ncbi:MAG: heme biosynthesis HemY N-terminal domain-containing protein [Pseudomonadota bacterium]
MKVAALAILIAIVLGGLVGTLLVRDAGYVLVAYGDLVLETSLWVALLLLIGVYLLVRGLALLWSQTTRGPFKLSNWRSSRRLRNARAQTVRGLLVMSEGRWAEAQKLLLAGAERVETPLINYLNAARTAHELGQVQQRDEFLKRAHESTPGAKFAVTLNQAEFHISDAEYEQALAALLVLRKRAPRHGAVLQMLSRCYEALADWPALRELLPDLGKHKVLGKEELTRLQRLVWQNRLSTDEDVTRVWKQLPKALKQDTTLLVDWVTHLLAQERRNDAEQAIRLILGQHWDAALITLYGQVRSDDVQRQLVTAQRWAKERPNDAALMLTLGRLNLMNEKFEQARDCLENSLRLHPDHAVYAELGRLCIAQGDERRGTEYLLRSLGDLADLPQPRPEPLSQAAN